MKIAHIVQNYYPSVGGMQSVVKEISQRLVDFGHEVTVLTSLNMARSSNYINGVKINSFNLKGNLVKGIGGSKNDKNRFIDDICGDFDILTIFASQYWGSDMALMNIEKIKAKKVFVPTGFSKLNDPLYQKKYFSLMPEWLSKMDLNIFLSVTNQDYLFAKKFKLNNNIVIPNGASESEFNGLKLMDMRREFNITPNAVVILHVGGHTGEKGHNELFRIFDKAEFGSDAVLVVNGNDFNDGCKIQCQKFASRINKSFKNKRVVLCDLPREKLLAMYHQADIFCFPSNLECSPLVLMEAMAAGLPFLSSASGNAEELVRNGGGGMILPTHPRLFVRNQISNFIKIIIKKIIILNLKSLGSHANYVSVDIKKSVKILNYFAENLDLRRKLGLQGRSYWQQFCTWNVISKMYEEAYLKLLK
ncbi:hypothetical protein COT94_01845 [Candidatus Falkowbacteria bacterium CG10_big_fil_rev_8_21_14_0_10_37_14]|uniref:Glycosyl transferase family 1 domain-containing protein n=1 Tax=Candidatus Falkowbacteria bacterium CG10_big_fil_rev_8_21_14_0_10_37_14 TaxID=1974561 RepID=A0A2M6WTS1_9BACT|nr:glycosyltransferase family 4 protein [Candidatus Falkowbacteria bacterium]PIT96189.1 MAG: hypothetical protein COT94_01845 [Candidatus Falkowbacteria bacterium CG10_big_fil_rev_8_21_14_0_10_37_14]